MPNELLCISHYARNTGAWVPSPVLRAEACCHSIPPKEQRTSLESIIPPPPPAAPSFCCTAHGPPAHRPSRGMPVTPNPRGQKLQCNCSRNAPKVPSTSTPGPNPLSLDQSRLSCSNFINSNSAFCSPLFNQMGSNVVLGVCVGWLKVIDCSSHAVTASELPMPDAQRAPQWPMPRGPPMPEARRTASPHHRPIIVQRASVPVS